MRYISVVIGKVYCDERVCVSLSLSLSVCVCECVCVFIGLRSFLRNYTSDLHQLLCASRSYFDAFCTAGFMDDVIFAHKPRLLDVAAQLKRSAHAALGLAMNCAQ